MHGIKLADIGEGADHSDDVGQLADGPGVRLLGDQLGHAHEVVLVRLVGHELGDGQPGYHVPGGMVDQVVLLGGAHERGEVGGIRERVEIILVAEERFPLLAVLPPARCPQRHEIALGQSELDRNDVLSHWRSSW